VRGRFGGAEHQHGCGYEDQLDVGHGVLALKVSQTDAQSVVGVTLVFD
jgi:hypothetical protein